MISLKNLGIAPPDQVTYQPSSVVYVRGDMSRVGDGFAVVSWIWDTISIEKLSQLLKFVGSSTYANVFIQTDVRDGTHAVAENAFKVFSAMMWKPLLYGQEGVPIAKSPYVMQTVNIQFVNLVEQVGYLSI
jgi:hypothetical protein